jgi:hypothetical protein
LRAASQSADATTLAAGLSLIAVAIFVSPF